MSVSLIAEGLIPSNLPDASNSRHARLGNPQGRFRALTDRDGGVDARLGARRSVVPADERVSKWERWAVPNFSRATRQRSGGISLLSVLNHAQVVSGRER